jgi:predicted metal-binding protein
MHLSSSNSKDGGKKQERCLEAEGRKAVAFGDEAYVVRVRAARCPGTRMIDIILALGC